jgi:NADPH-dependent 2,4-dienoyl-CoA reductase/sulfur reductase-like enzyme
LSKYIIIGGVAGGATAAARLRRLDEKAEIILLERGEYISYANCGLPYYAGGTIKERSKLFVMTPARFKATLAVDVRTGHEAIEIQPKAKTVKIVERASGRSYVESYDALVLSPGAEPIRPPIPGIDDKRIFTLRTVPDIDAIKERMDARRPERAIVVGAGFIGLEMAENLRERGVFVTIVEALDQVMNVIDFEMAAIVHQHLKAKGVELYLNDAVSAFAKDGERIVAKLRSGKNLPADMVILSIGVKPETSLARAAGLALDGRGYIVTDAHMRTSDPSIYAVGDAVVVKNPITGKPSAVPLAGPANKQARIAADNIAGALTSEYRGAIGTAIAKVFDLTVACTGLAEKACEKDGISYRSVIVHPSSHASYYPGAKPFSLKLVFDPKGGKILGAQAVGYEGVDKRIDVIAAFIAMGANVSALKEFEHAYAPPFSSAKDPVNYAGFVAEDLLDGKSQQVGWKDVEPLRKKGAFILDARTPEEFALGRIEGAVNIPNTEIRTRMGELPRDRFILVYCGVGFAATWRNAFSNRTDSAKSPTSQAAGRPIRPQPQCKATRASIVLARAWRQAMPASLSPMEKALAPLRTWCCPPANASTSTPAACSAQDPSFGSNRRRQGPGGHPTCGSCQRPRIRAGRGSLVSPDGQHLGKHEGRKGNHRGDHREDRSGWKCSHGLSKNSWVQRVRERSYTDRVFRRFGQGSGQFRDCERRRSDGQEGHHVLHFLGTVRHQTAREGPHVQRFHGQDVQLDAASQFAKAVAIQDELRGPGSWHDARTNEGQADRPA